MEFSTTTLSFMASWESITCRHNCILTFLQCRHPPPLRSPFIRKPNSLPAMSGRVPRLLGLLGGHQTLTYPLIKVRVCLTWRLVNIWNRTDHTGAAYLVFPGIPPVRVLLGLFFLQHPYTLGHSSSVLLTYELAQTSVTSCTVFRIHLFNNVQKF
ncbi:hypothetical protein THAOC_28880 [Thalassiosira oceanica]|uniref:Uncharacterized protein n=1 Tax=Thalassiosira oceanica TaxID=159749 RepID=K0RSJ6_THAOC|nr:hypothetical protein THAOC_28880 [Thalassiosira oceanica]|eukprot:EJK51906.1 hypothetical protein THAOC_28880 [Thalassiosira oceanica]